MRVFGADAGDILFYFVFGKLYGDSCKCYKLPHGNILCVSSYLPRLLRGNKRDQTKMKQVTKNKRILMDNMCKDGN